MSDDFGLSVEVSSKFYLVNPEPVLNLARFLLRAYGFNDVELSIRLCDDNDLHALNADYRKRDRPTDVLAFPQLEWRQALTLEDLIKRPWEAFLLDLALKHVLGDIVISLQRVEQQAADFLQSMSVECTFLLIHGFLHLLGHDHQNPEDERVMLAEQSLLLQKWRNDPTSNISFIQPLSGDLVI